MAKYILNRVLVAILTMFVLTTSTFFLLRLVPGDPFAGPKVIPEIKERLRIHYGLDKPLAEQYFIYMGNILRGDFGYSLAKRGYRVNEVIKDAFPQSLDLGIRAMIMSIIFGLFFGIIAALNRGKPLDYLIVVLVLIGISVPSFVVAALLQYFFWSLFENTTGRPLRYFFAYADAFVRVEPGNNGCVGPIYARQHAGSEYC